MLEQLVARALRHGGEFADVFCERRRTVSYRLQDGRIHDASYGVALGVGVRVVVGESAGYASSDDLSPEALNEAADAASLIARSLPGGDVQSVDLVTEQTGSLYDDNTPVSADAARYVAMLESADSAARRYDPRIVAVNAHVTDELQEVWIATSEGRLVADCRPLVTLGVQAVASENRERGSGYVGDGGRTSIAYFERETPEMLAAEAARIATVNVGAVPAPAGEMEMIVGAGGGGVLLHEAVGHGLESDFNRRGTSLYSGRIGERVASDLVTIYDDGNLREERGSINVDDEGVPGQHKVLVENGVLLGYMQDRLNARLMGVESTGSGRRQSFRFVPQPRMCNTYMPSGTATVDEIVASTRRGIYAKSFAGGQVEIAKGDFVFMV
ncbi:MAG: metalloprotease TldD, partial [Candidatus Eremiobacteraeota bacterium]|nr:metalloprotease TldD [Candidatus Eremiobacteraeota bacterium]